MNCQTFSSFATDTVLFWELKITKWLQRNYNSIKLFFKPWKHSLMIFGLLVLDKFMCDCPNFPWLMWSWIDILSLNCLVWSSFTLRCQIYQVPEFEEAAFSAPLNKVVGCKTKFGWHLLQVLSERYFQKLFAISLLRKWICSFLNLQFSVHREESNLEYIKPIELHEKIQHPSFLEEAQLIDVREPEEVYEKKFILC